MSGPWDERAFAELRCFGGFRTILADPPWAFEHRSAKGHGKAAQRHYECVPFDDLRRLPVELVAADDCALFLWSTWPLMPKWAPLIEAWGFEYAGLAWEWLKFNPETGKFAFGPGYGTRKNVEPCLLATKGNPMLRTCVASSLQDIFAAAEGVHSVRDFILTLPGDVIASPRREHSRKPEEQYRRIETLFDGPYLELFSRASRPGWTSWGNEVGKFEQTEEARFAELG